MSTIQGPSLSDKTGEILTLESSIDYKISVMTSVVANTRGSQSKDVLSQERDVAVDQIRGIVDATLNKGTASYGIRVLSKYGFTVDELSNLAQGFNNRGQEFAKTADHPHNHDFPRIDNFYMQNGIGFDHYIRKENGEFGPPDDV